MGRPTDAGVRAPHHPAVGQGKPEHGVVAVRTEQLPGPHGRRRLRAPPRGSLGAGDSRRTPGALAAATARWISTTRYGFLTIACTPCARASSVSMVAPQPVAS